MNVNPDPRPGRWLLPLVVLGMVLFTYVFVNQLPGEGAPPVTTGDGTAAPTVSTTTPDGSEPDDPDAPTDTTAATTPVTPDTTAYLEAMQALGTQLTGYQAELSAANAAWEEGGDGSYAAAQTAFTEIANQVADWRDQVVAVSVPEGMAGTHDTLVQSAEQAANQAAAALDGLVNAPGPDARVEAVARFDDAVSAFSQALTEAGG